MGINGRQQEQVKEDVPKDRQEEGKCVPGILTTIGDSYTLCNAFRQPVLPRLSEKALIFFFFFNNFVEHFISENSILISL